MGYYPTYHLVLGYPHYLCRWADGLSPSAWIGRFGYVEKTTQTVNTDSQDIFYTMVFQIVEHLQNCCITTHPLLSDVQP